MDVAQKQYNVIGSSVVEIAIKTGDKDYAGTDVPMRMKICDEDDHCCLTAENLHSQFGNDRERGALDVYDQVNLLDNCKNVKFHIFTIRPTDVVS